MKEHGDSGDYNRTGATPSSHQISRLTRSNDVEDKSTLDSRTCQNLSVSIDPTDIDFMGHVNNATYLKWVQAAVLTHWRRVAPAAAVSAYLWIAVKHEIVYRKPAFLGDRIVVRTQLQRVQRESAFYETVIWRGEDILAEVESRWCCLDAESLSPARLDSATVAHFFPQEGQINKNAPSV